MRRRQRRGSQFPLDICRHSLYNDPMIKEPDAADIAEYEELLSYDMDEQERDDQRSCEINYNDAWLNGDI